MNCDVCGSESLSQADIGFYVCDECGTQSQNFLDETMEHVQGVNDTNIRLRKKTNAADEAPEEIPEIDYGEDEPSDFKDVLDAYVKGMQVIIQAQCSALVEKRACTAGLSAVVRRLWFGHLATHGILSPSFLKSGTTLEPDSYGVTTLKPAAKCHPQVIARESGGDANTADEDEDEEMTQLPEGYEDEDEDEEVVVGQDPTAHSVRGVGEAGGEGDMEDLTQTQQPQGLPPSVASQHEMGRGGLARFMWGGKVFYGQLSRQQSRVLRTRKLQDDLARHLPMILSLALCYLGCIWLREPITTVDLVRWAADGDLPYLNARGLTHDILKSKVPSWRLQPQCVPYTSDVETAAAMVSASLKLSLPPMNAPLLARRYIQDLQLPQCLSAPVARLHSLVSHPKLQLARRPHSRTEAPHVYTMAILIVAIRLLFGLKGQDPNTEHEAKRPKSVPSQKTAHEKLDTAENDRPSKRQKQKASKPGTGNTNKDDPKPDASDSDRSDAQDIPERHLAHRRAADVEEATSSGRDARRGSKGSGDESPSGGVELEETGPRCQSSEGATCAGSESGRPHWRRWARGCAKRGLHRLKFPAYPMKTNSVPPEMREEYLRFVKEVIFAGMPSIPGQDEYLKKIVESHQTNKRDDSKARTSYLSPLGASHKSKASEFRSESSLQSCGIPQEAFKGQYVVFPSARRFPSDYMAVLTACAAHVWVVPQFMHDVVREIENAMLMREAAGI